MEAVLCEQGSIVGWAVAVNGSAGQGRDIRRQRRLDKKTRACIDDSTDDTRDYMT
jgi:hypothetical protein